MTMAEFNIRLFAFKRMTKDNERLFREVAYYSMIGSHLDPKKVPKTKQKFWAIGSDVRLNREQLERNKEIMLKAASEYVNRKNKNG